MNLKDAQTREVIHVLIDCCVQVRRTSEQSRFLFSHLFGDVLNMLPVVVSRKGHTILTMRILAKNSVNTNGSISECCTLKCGIPQVTILGLLLFLLYINDLPNCLSHSEARMYAHDTHLTYWNGDIHSIQSSLDEDLLNINRWLTTNKLTLNMTKTKFMLIGSR